MTIRMLEATIPTTKYQILRRFYRDHVGLKVASEGQHHVFFDILGAQLALVDVSEGDSLIRPSGHGIYLNLATVDLNTLKRRLIRHGVVILSHQNNAHGNSIIIRDPEGNILNIFQEGSF